MSKQIKKLTRRNFLKGAACTSALSSLAFAETPTLEKETHETVTLFNQSDKTVELDALQPVSLQKLNGWVMVNINKASSADKQVVTLAAGQRLSFVVDSELAPLLKDSGDYIVITNEFSVLNNTVPVSTYDTLVA